MISHPATLQRLSRPPAIAQKKGDPVSVERDEHPRAGSSMETLGRLRPLFSGGSVTAGNASGVNDGAAAIIIASEAAAIRHGLTPIARILGGATAGVPPRIMGMGPAPTTEKLCARLGVTPSAFDVIELNEAFASQALPYCADWEWRKTLPTSIQTAAPSHWVTRLA